MEELLSLIQGPLNRREAEKDILSVNDTTREQGLVFTTCQAAALIHARDRALHASGRLELYGGVIKKLILAFYESPYFEMKRAEETISDLIEIFYYLKNETFDTFSDDEMIAKLLSLYNSECRGDLTLLQDAAYTKLAKRAHGINMEDEEEDGDDEYDGGL